LLWDVGFQLSYLALFGIVWLQKPIERLLYFKQKWLGKIWEMLAVTVAAQIATFPVCIYYFHQFPNLFFVTNLIAVPLSTLILFAEILLILVSGFPILALYTGKLVGIIVWLMNRIIISINGLPFSLWEGIYVNLPAMISLYLVITCFCCWLLYQNKKAFQLALICLVIFTTLHANAVWIWKHQLKMIIYNVPNFRAIDFIYQDQYFFAGDSTLIRPGGLQNMHLKPARIVFQVKSKTNRLPNLSMGDHFFSFFSKKILLVDQMVACDLLAKKVQIDVLIISKNAALTMEEITRSIKPSVIVFDSSNSLWKIAKWKKECIALALPCFSIPEQGAFILNID
jgi:competence protein ComEC